ncbi:D-alanine--D-alanine ligase [candidate division KSB1 bacterium]|nr:D-alanine--D-alanine ligase [candidate division KSB1 bacterium]
MDRKIRVGILFGGKSAEHEVSLQSAKNVVDAIDKEKYEVVLIGIDKSGQWHLNESSNYLLNADNPKLIALNKASEKVTLVPRAEKNELVKLTSNQSAGPLDVIFPVLHGTFGEDGTVQGFLKLADVPFVGAGVLGSAVGMDKDVMKRLLRDAGLPIGDFLVFHKKEIESINFNALVERLGLPFFVKPANLGSSVGISKVKDFDQFEEAIRDAFNYDNKILIEEYVEGREIECSVLGNEDPIASLPGEVIPQHEWYSYEAKYIDEAGAKLVIPADLPDHLIKKFQQRAVEAFKVLCCEGMARVDCFLRKKDDEVMIHEINTIPGFTKISMYPKLWEVSGIPYKELIDRLIQLAIERHESEKELKTSVEL